MPGPQAQMWQDVNDFLATRLDELAQGHGPTLPEPLATRVRAYVRNRHNDGRVSLILLCRILDRAFPELQPSSPEDPLSWIPETTPYNLKEFETYETLRTRDIRLGAALVRTLTDNNEWRIEVVNKRIVFHRTSS